MFALVVLKTIRQNKTAANSFLWSTDNYTDRPLERDYYIKNKLEISRFVNVYCFFITTKKAIHVVIMGGALQQELRWKPC